MRTGNNDILIHNFFICLDCVVSYHVESAKSVAIPKRVVLCVT